MDKEQARFILQSFRPDGADAHDPDFAQALAVAAENRDLGAWLAVERAQDSAFALALSKLEIPDDLREPLWDTKLALLLIGTLGAAEWIGRKWAGMV